MPNTAPIEQPKTFSPPTKGTRIIFAGKTYIVGDFINKGHFGRVYECADEWGNQLVAKVLVPSGRTYGEVEENWLTELQKLKELRHPNITYVYAAFECDDTFYLVMERCSMTLDVIINLKDLHPDRWIPHVARDILQGLDYIHSSGYVHKDIHPGNVFVSQSQDRMIPSKDAVWSFKIGDLGISRLETEINAFNTVLAEWMLPPEAIDSAEFGFIGRTVDIYHVGLLLLALVLNRVPTFTREEVLAGVPRQLAESSSSKFGPAIARALRRHVANRTPTALHFWQDIYAT
jgi:serine/threonine protein kinase